MINMFVLYREESNGKRDLCVAVDKDRINIICAVIPLEIFDRNTYNLCSRSPGNFLIETHNLCSRALNTQ